jgi:diaminopropionate ammonia-lyase
MAGLNAGWPSPVAWPAVHSSIDLFLAVSDDDSRAAMRALARDGIVAGETGAAGVAGLMALCSAPQLGEMRQAFGLNGNTDVLALSTEGATDPAGYAQIVGITPQT